MKRDLEHLDLKQAFHPVPEACRRALMDAATVDACLACLDEAGLRPAVLASLLRAIQLRLDRRTGGALSAGAILFSNVYGELGRTETAREVLQEWETAFSMA